MVQNHNMASKKTKTSSGKGSRKAKTSRKTPAYFWPIVCILAGIIVVYFITAGNKDTGHTRPGESPRITTESGNPEFRKEAELAFTTPGGALLATIDIQLADDDIERAVGLMHRDNLGTDCGMLFIFAREETRSFWMRNTHIPLDIIFVNANKEIVSIHKNTTPYVEEQYSSGLPALYVVEVNAGFTDAHNINIDDVINW